MTIARPPAFPVRSFGAAAACVTLLLLATAAAAQDCVVPCDQTGTCLCVIAPVDAEVGLTRLGTVEQETAQVGQALRAGDQLTSVADDTVVELVCPGGSGIKLHGRFHAVVLPSRPDQDCVLNVLAGNADVLARMPTSLVAGEATMGSITTRYGMRVYRDGDEVRFECVVFEGAAEVRYGADRQWTLEEAARLSWSPGWQSAQRSTVTAADVDIVSRVYARADVARSQLRGERPADPAALEARLQSAYANVLARPSDPDARIELAALQTDLGDARLALTTLEHAEDLEEASRSQRREIRRLRDLAAAQAASIRNTPEGDLLESAPAEANPE